MASITKIIPWFALIILILSYHVSKTVSRPLNTSTTTTTTTRPHDTIHMKHMHEQWIAKYERVYKNAQEKQKRFDIFKENVKRINKFNDNKKKKSYRLSVNEFTDLTSDEIRSTRKGSRSFMMSSRLNDSIDKSVMNASMSTSSSFDGDYDQSNIASSVDWRTRGAVTPIKNQGQCASCWAFATVAAIESINQIKTGQLISLSEQDILDCLNTAGNGGCNGGVMSDAFNFVSQGNRLPTESQYPYQGDRGQYCRHMPSAGGVTIRGFQYMLQPNDFNALRGALNSQPVAISIDSESFDFEHYGGGIFDKGLRRDYTDHDVLLIGYGSDENGVKYWLLKNSWGVNWGEGGYMRLLMDENQCPIAPTAFVPLM